jgi:CheY-like chemotaxis protein
MKKLKNVMLVDDDDTYQFLCGKIISDSGITENVIPCMSGEDALSYLKQKKGPVPELILLDINMPGMNGWDFLEEFKILPPELKTGLIIAMHSSSIFPEDKIKAGGYKEVADFIEKPLTTKSAKELVERIFPE